MVLVATLVAVLLAVVTTYQATYPNAARVRTKRFKYGVMALAIGSGVLLVYTTWQNERAQSELQEAIAGVSKTVFDRDLEMGLHITYASAGNPAGFVGQPFVILTVLPSESSEFCKIGVTSTPIPDSFVGQLFTKLDPAPGHDDLIGFGDPTAHIFKFFFNSENARRTVSIDQRATAMPLVTPRHMSLDEYQESQFIAELVVPGTVERIDQVMLYVKGKPIPFEVVRAGDRWIGSTVFRSTWEMRCRKKQAAANGIKGVRED